ncbi:glycoside hydrolase family 26 protein [Microbacterium ureisolvens]|uniref:Beta-mannanase n=1 Tax=Microbacterium ureisolvens TaxID=2781186 RepID=A0ABS7I294_9MICO|nr:glycosyl hydrolase [Microbacterium ureisolvens]MBW9110729.1 beta-mannanase [Microbacterium ureisolvens]
MSRIRRAGAAVAVAFGLLMGVIAVPTPASAATGTLALSPSAGPVGTSVTVTGAGFGRKRPGTVMAGTATAAFTTTASGTFRATVIIPATTAPALAVTATTVDAAATAWFAVSQQAPAAPTISSARLRFGVTTPGGATADAELDAVARLAGENPGLVLSYHDFAQSPPIAGLDSVAARGATSILTWEPWRWGGGATQASYSNAQVIAGAYDTYLQQWGASLAAWGKPVYVRYAHEMNGNWYPWSDGVNGNASGSYAAAWRHVHEVVTAAGATNVQWVWSPNVPYAGSTPLASVYPGSAYVDAVALDGYNWGTSQPWSSWVTPQALFADGLAQLRAMAPGKPIIVAETASAEAGGSKATWNADLVAHLAAQPDVTGLVWFHHDKEVDWRIDSTPGSASALASALAARRA